MTKRSSSKRRVKSSAARSTQASTQAINDDLKKVDAETDGYSIVQIVLVVMAIIFFLMKSWLSKRLHCSNSSNGDSLNYIIDICYLYNYIHDSSISAVQHLSVLEDIWNKIGKILLIYTFIVTQIIDKRETPKPEMISVQLNIFTGLGVERPSFSRINSNVSERNAIRRLNTEDLDIEEGVEWDVVYEGKPQIKMFNNELRKARKKPIVLKDQCPKLCLLDVGPFKHNELVWQQLFGLVKTLLMENSVSVQASCSFPTRARHFIYCITFERKDTWGKQGVGILGDKMRLLIVNKDQLEYLSEHEDYGTKQASEAEFSPWSNQRLEQMKELARHVKDTGGFDELVPGNDDRYYGVIKLRMKR